MEDALNTVLLDELEEEEEEDDQNKERYLSFPIGGNLYGISMRYVQEIIPIQPITGMPNMPSFIVGVINLRGQIVTVMDIRIRFHLPERPYESRTCIIVLNFNERKVGLIVDTVAEVVSIPMENIDPPPRNPKNPQNRFIEGMGKVEKQVKVLLNIEAILYDGTRFKEN